jgi:hypothetical protein
VFDDEWVRLDVDQFADNISLFGGVDFLSSFVAARQATPEFLSGLDLMAEDVCGRAAELGTGPFAGVDTTAAIVDEPPSTSVSHEAEAATTTIIGLPAGCLPGANATRVVLCTNASLNVSHVFPIDGTYRISAAVQGAPNADGPPLMAIRVDGVDVAEVEVPFYPGLCVGVPSVPARAASAHERLSVCSCDRLPRWRSARASAAPSVAPMLLSLRVAHRGERRGGGAGGDA